MEKSVIYSGIQPSMECLMLGNYLGAVKNWVKIQDEPDKSCIFSVVDMHAITVRQTPADLRRRTVSFAAQYIAAGISPEKNLIYVQSHVPAHAMLTWVLNCFTYVGEMSRMTQFKEKSARHADNVNMGLMDYPVLMAADILLYNTNLVPVGEDQRQHLEIARDLALRFNNAYSPTFTVPEPFIQKDGARIKSLAEPEKKMSKSDENENATVYFTDDADTIMRKFKRAMTDSGTDIIADEKKPGITNLLTIYANSVGISAEKAQNEFEGKTYAQFKEKVAEAVIALFAPMQKEYKKLMDDKTYLENVLKKGAEEANKIANKTLSKVMRKVGFYQ